MRGAYVIRTPENVPFEYELAGIASRGLAWAVDVVVMAALVIVGQLLLTPLILLVGGFAVAIQIFYVSLVIWWYAALCEWWLGGQTLGKKAVGLRTLQDNGLRLSFVQAVIRNLVRIVDLLPALYLVGAASSLFDRHGRRLGDLAAGTIVVRERRTPMPSAVVPASERYNSFISDPAVIHAARKITAPERDAMVGLGLRRDRLPLAVRHDLFSRMSAHLEERLAVARPSFFSEEKFVLNLTAIVLGQAAERRSRPSLGLDARADDARRV